MDVPQLKQRVCEAVDGMREELLRVSHAIHARPELAFEEHEAAALLVSTLRGAGLPVEPGAYGLPTAFEAEAGAGSSCVALLAEYDALPEIGHACGHNLIASSAIAAAVGAKAAFFDGSAGGAPAAPGRLVILGTPAEESGGGKVELIKRGALADVDVAMMVHPAPVDLLYPAFNAIERVVFQFAGKNAHAAMAPHDGVNALDAVVSLFNNVGLARQQFKPSWRLHGIISHGGVKPNIIPDFTEAYFYARAPTMDEVHVVKAKLVACAEGAAVRAPQPTTRNAKISVTEPTGQYTVRWDVDGTGGTGTMSLASAVASHVAARLAASQPSAPSSVRSSTRCTTACCCGTTCSPSL